MTISQVYREYWESIKTSNLRHRCGWKKNMQDQDQRRLARIIKGDRRATLPLIAADFHAGPSTNKYVTWFDESRFQLNGADGRVRVVIQPHESMDPTWQQGTVQAGGGAMMVSGVCSWTDMGPLMRLDTTLSCDRYVSILSDHLHPFMYIVHSVGLGEFKQGSVTPHKSRIATVWLQEHSFEFRHFCWPL
ncbi:transposable element Tcb2 transposase [Trichonephila clavipes]|nr:transposable element Tcb2 transposase [Trichonephila clavipes]